MRTIRTLCTAAVIIGLTAGTADGQIWQQRGSQDRRAPARAEQGRKVPPGLAKKGGLPPGQAKKLYRTDQGARVLRDVLGRRGYTVVRTTRSGDIRYIYYRTRSGPVRRAAVRPGRERLIFVDVPQLVLREVVARLY